MDEELFAADRWPWLGGEALVETILWDSSRHYDAHREHLERLSREAVGCAYRIYIRRRRRAGACRKRKADGNPTSIGSLRQFLRSNSSGLNVIQEQLQRPRQPGRSIVSTMARISAVALRHASDEASELLIHRAAVPRVLVPERTHGCASPPSSISLDRLVSLAARISSSSRSAMQIFGPRQLERVLHEFIDHYRCARPHQGLGQRTPIRGAYVRNESDNSQVIRSDRIGGLTHEYARVA